MENMPSFFIEKMDLQSYAFLDPVISLCLLCPKQIQYCSSLFRYTLYNQQPYKC